MNVSVSIRLNEDLGPIRPELHGHFLEHLGSAVYGGVWVGEDSPIPNIRGFRKAAVQYLRELEIPVLRWPGGCFADAYHWRDGIGPRNQRPRRVNFWWGGTVEDNSVGTHEFMDFCELIGARPYLAANVGSGTPAEFRDWLEYCNYPSGSALSDERIRNGARNPFAVRFWGVGNESWGCGGHMNPEEYAALYSRWATYAPTYESTAPYLIAVGPESNNLDWTQRFFEHFRTTRKYHAPLHAFSMHFYSWGASTPTAYTRESLNAQLASFVELEQAITEQRALIDSFVTDPRIGRIGLILDEWGTWDKSDEQADQRLGKLWQQNTMRDGVAAALGLNVFHRQSSKLSMCNLAQLVNVLQAPLLASGDRCVRTPTYYSLLMSKPHRGNRSIGTHHESTLSISASSSADRLVITLVNPDPDTPTTTLCTADGCTILNASATILHHSDWNACNTFEEGEIIIPAKHPVQVSSGTLKVDMPGLSIVTIIARIS